jgi:uncharacterized RDD family membrane protein YckC
MGIDRFLAAQIDHTFSIVVFLAVAMNSAEAVGEIGAGAASLGAYLGYFFLPEWLLGATIGKSLFSLRVRQLSGAPCNARQAAIRTVLRFLEVNPLFLGALPAGLAILWTKRRQRLGDLIAGTIVVRKSEVARSNAAAVRIVSRRD